MQIGNGKVNLRKHTCLDLDVLSTRTGLVWLLELSFATWVPKAYDWCHMPPIRRKFHLLSHASFAATTEYKIGSKTFKINQGFELKAHRLFLSNTQKPEVWIRNAQGLLKQRSEVKILLRQIAINVI